MDTSYQFWMVWSPQAGLPTHMHATAASADEEARGATKWWPSSVQGLLRA